MFQFSKRERRQEDEKPNTCSFPFVVIGEEVWIPGSLSHGHRPGSTRWRFLAAVPPVLRFCEVLGVQSLQWRLSASRKCEACAVRSNGTQWPCSSRGLQQSASSRNSSPVDYAGGPGSTLVGWKTVEYQQYRHGKPRLLCGN
jgi:hypothetical protein